MGLVPARRPGWLLEGRGNPSPRGMAAQSRFRRRDGQNPAYRPSGVSSRLRRQRSNFLVGLDLPSQEHDQPYRSVDGEAEANGRLGVPPLALLRRQGPLGGAVRLCDREGCSEIGDRPAPKAPHSDERWYFCEAHAAEYNRNWNYFAGLSPEEAARRAAEEERGNAGYGSRRSGNGAGRATAAVAATRCARSTRSSSRATPTSRPSRRRIGGSSRRRIPTPIPAMRKRRSGSSRSRRPMTC